MLGEWTLEISQPNAEYVPHYLIRLNADGTMNFRAEDGSWLDYTYTIDATHFSFTYTGTGLSSSGTYPELRTLFAAGHVMEKRIGERHQINL